MNTTIEVPAMPNLKQMVSMLMLALLVAFTPTSWADRDDDGRRFQRDQPSPQRPVTQGGRVEIPERAAPGTVRQPPTKPQPQRVETRERRTPPEQERQVAPGRPVGPVPAPATVKNWRQEPKVPNQPPKPGWVLDTKYKHNHYYPPRGHIVPVLPPAHRAIVHRNVHYHYHDGIWYRPYGSHFIVVFPPFGLLVPVLPPFFTTIWVNSSTYYYAGGVYYNWWPTYQQYVVVEPPPEEKVRATANGGSDQLFIYPAAGQSEEQQARDRYECHRWAQTETGFDPTTPGGGVEAGQHTSKRADYFRAMKACLEAHRYSVQ